MKVLLVMHAIGPHFFPRQESRYGAKYVIVQDTSSSSYCKSRNIKLDSSVWATDASKMNKAVGKSLDFLVFSIQVSIHGSGS